MNKRQGDNLQPSKAKSKRRRRNKGMCLEDWPVLGPNAAGIDVGAREMFVAVPPGRDEKPVRVFATFTEDLERLTDWLERCCSAFYNPPLPLRPTSIACRSMSGCGNGAAKTSSFPLCPDHRPGPLLLKNSVRTSRSSAPRSFAFRPSILSWLLDPSGRRSRPEGKEPHQAFEALYRRNQIELFAYESHSM